jgi:UDPglucose 6-dehydrogenase
MATNICVGVIGNGFVGKATQIFGRSENVRCIVYDIDPDKCFPSGTTMDTLIALCDIIFVCVPTPMRLPLGNCDTTIVESVVRGLGEAKAKVIVRSTVPPGTCEKLGVSHMPEYLTEAHWERDFIECVEWHLGVDNNDVLANKFAELLNTCHESRVILSKTLVTKPTKVTETTKYFKNAMLAVRVSLCNEFEEYCRAINVDYNEVREMFTSDPRIGKSHTMVPGHDGQRGFGGTCLPKDISGLIVAMLEAGVMPTILNAAKTRNETTDRPDCDWLQNIGRAVSN